MQIDQFIGHETFDVVDAPVAYRPISISLPGACRDRSSGRKIASHYIEYLGETASWDNVNENIPTTKECYIVGHETENVEIKYTRHKTRSSSQLMNSRTTDKLTNNNFFI